ncbi:MAG: saccharopine dehydrogenase NADP-binding domain-containing protein [Elusimicrobia bacterium]|nr:saccharopine dehydrogenase NADP-binding domain-containing protein [Elusimicrobiota bacterium]
MGNPSNRFIVVIGCGRQAAAIVYDLARYGRDIADTLVLADRDPKQIRTLTGRVRRALVKDHLPLPKITAKRIDAKNAAQLNSLIRGAKAVISSSHYSLNPVIARAAVGAGVPFGDLGGYLESSLAIQKLDAAARKKGIFLAPDLGLAPGLANVLAGWGLAHMDRDLRLSIYCGGLPEKPVGPLGYKIVFAVEGLWGTHFGQTVILEGGRPKEVQALGDVEEIDFGVLGRLEAFITGGALATAPWTLRNRVHRYVYKTLRYPGYTDKMKFLADLGLTDDKVISVGDVRVSPRQLLGRLFYERLAFPETRDLVALRVTAEGRLNNSDRYEKTVFEMIEHADDRLGFSAMERTTGFPAAASMLMLLRKKPSGFLLLEEALDAEAFIEELKKRNIAITRRSMPCPQPQPEKTLSA